jgi:hypothetical protein
MALHDDLLRAARGQRERVAVLSGEIERAVAAYHRHIRLLHAAGGATGEIAGALGLDEREVAEIVGETAGGPGGSGGEAAVPGAGPGAGAGQRPRGRRFLVACSFCGVVQGTGPRLVAGPGVHVCERCVRRALDVLVRGVDDPALRFVGDDPHGRLRCSFCGKHALRVGGLVGGAAGIHVCGECLDLCSEILRGELGA